MVNAWMAAPQLAGAALKVTIQTGYRLRRQLVSEGQTLQEAKPEPRNPELLAKGTQEITSTTWISFSAKILCDKVQTFRFTTTPG